MHFIELCVLWIFILFCCCCCFYLVSFDQMGLLYADYAHTKCRKKFNSFLCILDSFSQCFFLFVVRSFVFRFHFWCACIWIEKAKEPRALIFIYTFNHNRNMHIDRVYVELGKKRSVIFMFMQKKKVFLHEFLSLSRLFELRLASYFV